MLRKADYFTPNWSSVSGVTPARRQQRATTQPNTDGTAFLRIIGTKTLRRLGRDRSRWRSAGGAAYVAAEIDRADEKALTQ